MSQSLWKRVEGWKAEGQQKDGEELSNRQPAQAAAPSTLA